MQLEVLKFLPISSMSTFALMGRRWAAALEDDRTWRILAPIHGVEQSRFLGFSWNIQANPRYQDHELISGGNKLIPIVSEIFGDQPVLVADKPYSPPSSFVFNPWVTPDNFSDVPGWKIRVKYAMQWRRREVICQACRGKYRLDCGHIANGCICRDVQEKIKQQQREIEQQRRHLIKQDLDRVGLKAATSKYVGKDDFDEQTLGELVLERVARNGEACAQNGFTRGATVAAFGTAAAVGSTLTMVPKMGTKLAKGSKKIADAVQAQKRYGAKRLARTRMVEGLAEIADGAVGVPVRHAVVAGGGAVALAGGAVAATAHAPFVAARAAHRKIIGCPGSVWRDDNAWSAREEIGAGKPTSLFIRFRENGPVARLYAKAEGP